jgi:hypothetical protein
VAYRVDDDFRVRHLVEDEIWIWRRRHPSDGGIVCRRTC